MRRNLINLAIVCSILVLMLGCVRSERGKDDAPAQYQTDPADNAGIATNQQKNKDAGDFVVEHLDITSPKFAEIDRQVKDEKLLEKAADQLNRALILPQDITLRTKSCGQINAQYLSSDHSVTICYELMDHFYNVFRSAGEPEQKAYDKMFEASRFVFLHEIGHALIDVYNLPVTGNEEDAADRLAAYVNLAELGEDGERSVFAAAEAFDQESKQNGSSGKNLADEHLLQEQRFYNSLCMIYGSNPTKYADIVTKGYLPKERASKCQSEYQRAADAWASLLEPWRKN